MKYLLLLLGAAAFAATPESVTFFEGRVGPVLSTHCHAWHSAEAKPAWRRSGIDGFPLAKIEEKKLMPVADAARLTLVQLIT